MILLKKTTVLMRISINITTLILVYVAFMSPVNPSKINNKKFNVNVHFNATDARQIDNWLPVTKTENTRNLGQSPT